MRRTGLMILSLSVAIAGICKACLYRQRAKCYRELARYFAFVRKTAEAGGDIFSINREALSRFPELTFLKEVSCLYEKTEDYALSWRQAAENFGKSKQLTGEGKELLRDFQRGFGESSLTEFAEICRRTEERFSQTAAEEENANAVRCRQAVLFGLSGGAALFLTFI